MVRDQEFITAFESQRAQHGVDTRGGIRHEHQALRVGSEELRERPSGIVEQLFKVANEELDRLSLKAIANLPLIIQHRSRAGSERAVVHVNHARVERPNPRTSGRSIQKLVMTPRHRRKSERPVCIQL